jgi:hypothetical protein
MRALSIVHESTDRTLGREVYPMRFLYIPQSWDRIHSKCHSNAGRVETKENSEW